MLLLFRLSTQLALAVFLGAFLATRVDASRGLKNDNASQMAGVLEGAVVNPASVTSQSQLGSVPDDYWDHVLNELPRVLPYAKLWTGGFCPMAFGNPAPTGPSTSKTACVRCTDGCAVCPSVFYQCDVCIPGYILEDGACKPKLY
jgi:hypothetical protein